MGKRRGKKSPICVGEKVNLATHLMEAEVGFDGVRGEKELTVAVQDHQEAVECLLR